MPDSPAEARGAVAPQDRAALSAALRVGPVETIIVVVVLLAVVGAVAWWLLREPAASLDIDGEPIANAQ